MRLILLFLMFIIGCDNGEVQTGGAETIPNFARGCIYDDNQTAVENREVEVIHVKLAHGRDSILSSEKCTTSVFGEFDFNHEGGSYVVSYKHNGRAVHKLFNIPKDQSQYNLGVIFTGTQTKVVGRIIDKIAGVRAYIPGINISSELDEDGVYSLDSVPTTVEHILFGSNSTVNYLPVSIAEDIDTTYVRDVEFADSLQEAYSAYSLYDSEGESYAIIPVYYGLDELPDWYADKDFGSIAYEEEPGTYFVFNEGDYADSLFSMKKMWGGIKVPSLGDTAIIAKTCFFDNSVTNAVIYLQQPGSIEIDDTAHFSSLHISGGIIKTDTISSLSGTITLGSAVFNIGWYMGVFDPFFGDSTSVIEKRGWGILQLNTSSETFSGNILVKEGKIRARTYKSLGVGRITISKGAMLDMETSQALQYVSQLTVEADSLDSGMIELNTPVSISRLIIGDSLLPVGKYSKIELPGVIIGSDTITVE